MTLVPIYIILLRDPVDYTIRSVGALYLSEKEAQAEVNRLNDASGFTSAKYIPRTINVQSIVNHVLAHSEDYEYTE